MIKHGNLYLVEVKGEPTEIELTEGDEHNNYVAYNWETTRSSIPIPKGNYELLGTLSDISEEEAAGIVEKTFESGDIKMYYDYTGIRGLSSALDSLRSLIESYNLNPEKVILIIKKEGE